MEQSAASAGGTGKIDDLGVTSRIKNRSATATEVPGSSGSAASPPTANLLPKPPISARRAFSLPSVVT